MDMTETLVGVKCSCPYSDIWIVCCFGGCALIENGLLGTLPQTVGSVRCLQARAAHCFINVSYFMCITYIYVYIKQYS